MGSGSGPKGSREALGAAEAEALAFLMPLSSDYPGLAAWFAAKVAPGLRAGTRTLHRLERGGRLTGLGIAKNEDGERKICTLRVAPERQGHGDGLRLMDAMLEWLDDDRPHFTVAEAKLPAFERIFERYRFVESWRRRGLYVPERTELGFNHAGTTPLPGGETSGNYSRG